MKIYKIYIVCVKLSHMASSIPANTYSDMCGFHLYIFSHGKMFNNQTGLIDSSYSTCLQIRRGFKSQSCPSLFLSFTSRMGFRPLSKIQTYKIYMVLRTLQINKPQNCLANKILPWKLYCHTHNQAAEGWTCEFEIFVSQFCLAGLETISS